MGIDFNTVTTLLMVSTMLTLVVGYARALTTHSEVVFHLVASIILVFLSCAARVTYWIYITPDAEAYNQLFPWLNLVTIWGGIHGHIAIYLMIPDKDRTKWFIFTAWLYPPFTMSVWLKRRLTRLVSWRS